MNRVQPGRASATRIVEFQFGLGIKSAGATIRAVAERFAVTSG